MIGEKVSDKSKPALRDVPVFWNEGTDNMPP
jgi:hypothetical protein